jgi:GntR family transcriptional regulator
MMTIDPTEDSSFLHVRVADAIAIGIVTGYLAGKLPSERQLAEDFGVAYATIRRAMADLRKRRLVITRPGWGNMTSYRTDG